MKRIVTACLSLLLALSTPMVEAADTSPQRIKVTPRQHTLTSHLNGQRYVLSVSLPPDYERDIGHAYPVLYVLDGQAQFTRVVGRYLNLYYQRRMPALILVGIRWQADADSEAWLADGEQPDFSAQRARDFSPFPTPGQADSGRAALFLNVLRTEILPAIEIQYRTASGQRALYGHDQGGLFGYYALFQSAGLFNQYLLTAPALVNATLALTLEGQYAGQSADLPARLFIATPDSEQALRQQITDKLASRHYPRLTVQGESAEGDAALDHGLGYLFTPESLDGQRQASKLR